jgi:uncharacterized protein DUF3574
MPVGRTLWVFLSAVTLSAVAGCSRAPAPAQPSPTASTVVSDRLFFGRNIPTGGTVTDSAWGEFLAEVVTPRFPNGFTVWSTQGQWRGADGAIVHEPGFVFEVEHPPGQPADSAFANIAAEYCRRFQQESVLRVRAPAEQWLYQAVVP